MLLAFITAVHCFVQEFFTENKTLGVLYTPTVDNLLFEYQIQKQNQNRNIDDDIHLTILFTSKKVLHISSQTPVDFMEEDEFETTLPCDLIQEERPHVAWDITGGCRLRVLSKVSSGSAYKIIKEETIQKATVFVTIKTTSGETSVFNNTINSDEPYYSNGVHISFSTSHTQQFMAQSVLLTQNGIADSFYYRYFNSQTGCNSFPTNIGYWKNKMLNDPTAHLNKYTFVPSPISSCTLEQGSSQKNVLEPFQQNRPFEKYANIDINGNAITMDSQLPRLPTIMVTFDSKLIHYSKPDYQLETTYRYFQDMKTQQFVLAVECTNKHDAFVSTILDIICGAKQFQIPSQFYNAGDVKLFEFNTTEGAPCAINNTLLSGNNDEISWSSNKVYESDICNQRFHVTINSTHCFSGCSIDTKLQGSNCVPDCEAVYGSARPYFDEKTEACVNYQSAVSLNLNIVKPPFQDQFSGFEIICEHGKRLESSSELQLPCTCEPGFNQMKKNATHLTFCIQNNYYSNPVIPTITGRDALAQFGKDFSDTFTEIVDSFGIFSNTKIFKIVMIVCCAVAGLLVLTVAFKIFGRLKCKSKTKQVPLSLSKIATQNSHADE